MKENKLIAEFMGMQHTDIGWYDNEEALKLKDNTFDKLNFHTSWDWLIPVMKKIDSYACEEMDFSDYDDYRNKYVFIHNISLHNDIREVYNQVVEFIKQLNKK